VSSQFLADVIQAWVLYKPNDNIQESKQVLWNHYIFIVSTKKEYDLLKTSLTLEVKGFMIYTFFSSLYDIPKTDFLKYHSLKSCKIKSQT